MDGTSRLLSLFDAGDRYVIPTYQRGYSWETEHVGELLQDLERAHEPNNEVSEHFFGTVLVTDYKETSGGVMKIIDGQQRLTTVTLLLICARNFFLTHSEKSDNAKKYCERLEEHLYKGEQKSPVLVLSRTNKKLFEEIMEPKKLMKALPGSHSESNDSNERLTRAYKAIRSWIKEREEEDIEIAIKTVYGYVRTLFEKFRVYKYHYDSEIKAYVMFNLVNNRGIGLNESDLIKNLLFGMMASRGMKDEELDGCDERWDEMRHNVTSKKRADYQLDRFFYHYLLTFYGNKISENREDGSSILRINQKKLHDSFKKITASGLIDPKTLIKDMENWSGTLDQLRNPSKSAFPRSNVIHYLEKIKDIKAVFVYPAILAGYKEYWDKKDYAQFEALVMMCFKYHVRVKVIGTSMSISAYQDIMYKITDKINSGVPIKTIIAELVKKEEEYPADSRIEQNLLELRVSSSKLAIALLEEAEYGYNEERSISTVSVEHIMPKSFTEWKDYIEKNNSTDLSAKEFHDQYFSLLGNQTLLSQKRNASASNKPFIDKQKEYYATETRYQMSKKLARHDGPWNGASIKERQAELTKIILEVISLTRLVDECRL